MCSDFEINKFQRDLHLFYLNYIDFCYFLMALNFLKADCCFKCVTGDVTRADWRWTTNRSSWELLSRFRQAQSKQLLFQEAWGMDC